jgi:SSS family solute:Na+ symporter
MLQQISGADTLVLAALLLVLPGAGIWVSLRKKTSEGYFLAGRKVRWWTVAASVFGTNISSFHLIGMLGVGYSIGFVQAHYEIVFPAILLLCYVFLASYRKLGLFTLSQYLEVRYGATARLSYSILLVLIILVQLVGAFYVGSLTLQWLFGGSSFSISYLTGLLVIGMVTCSYTLWGGMESIVVTDAIQTLLMLACGLTVAYFTFSQPEIGGVGGMLALDALEPAGRQRMHLYLPPDHPKLPWTGIFTGLLLQHCFNFTTNQFLVQRVLSASSDEDARKGIIASGWLKLAIPFFSIATGVAAYYLFRARFGEQDFNADSAFLKLVETVIPVGTGLTGLILAGLTAATFSAVDSMMNAATTLLTVDVYQRYRNPAASDRQLLRFGRWMVLLLVSLAVGLAWLTYTPDRSQHFFLKVSAQLSYFTPGIMAAFFFGVLWPRASTRGAVGAMLLGPVAGWSAEWIVEWLSGSPLNFLHRIALTFLFCSAVLIWLGDGKGDSRHLERYRRLQLTVAPGQFFRAVAGFLLLQSLPIALVLAGVFPARSMAWPGACLACLAFLPALRKAGRPYWRQDLPYAALLTGASVWLYYFFA